MAWRGIELDLEPGKVCEPALFRQESQELWVRGGRQQRSLWLF